MSAYAKCIYRDGPSLSSHQHFHCHIHLSTKFTKKCYDLHVTIPTKSTAIESRKPMLAGAMVLARGRGRWRRCNSYDSTYWRLRRRRWCHCNSCDSDYWRERRRCGSVEYDCRYSACGSGIVVVGSEGNGCCESEESWQCRDE